MSPQHAQSLGLGQPVPKHIQIREYVRALIDGALPGTPVPSEKVLMDRFGVARMTVRQGLTGLVNEGLIETVRGRGTFVADRRLRIAASLNSYTVEMRNRGLVPESQTLFAQLKVSGEGVAHALELEPGRRVVHWRRLRFANRDPMCIEDAYFSERLMPGFLSQPLPGSLYAELEKHDYVLTGDEDAVEAAIPSASDAHLLELDGSKAVLRVARRAYAGQRAVVVSRSIYRADRYVFLRPLHEVGT